MVVMSFLASAVVAMSMAVSTPAPVQKTAPIPSHPPKGTGMLAGGGVLLGLGVIASGIGLSFAAHALAPPPPPEPGLDASGLSRGFSGAFAVMFCVPGLLMLGSGAALVGVGAKRRQKYNAWRRGEGPQVMPAIAPTRGGAWAGLTLRF